MSCFQIVINNLQCNMLITNEIINRGELLALIAESYQQSAIKTVDNHSFFIFLCVCPVSEGKQFSILNSFRTFAPFLS